MEEILHHDAVAGARSFLFVPADRPDRFQRAMASGAGAVIVDLEDAIAPSCKSTARDSLVTGWRAISPEHRRRVVVRVNAASSAWYEDDQRLMQELVSSGLGGIMIPKAESVDEVRAMAAAVGSGSTLVPLIESAGGLSGVDALVRVPQVGRLAFGHLDFQLDLGLSCDEDEAELVAVRMTLVLASRRANLVAPVDGVSPDIQDVSQLEKDARRARRGGFGAKLCIHPSQVQVVNQAFEPSHAELQWARRVCDASMNAAGGVVTLDGRMIDAPVVKLAERMLTISNTG